MHQTSEFCPKWASVPPTLSYGQTSRQYQSITSNLSLYTSFIVHKKLQTFTGPPLFLNISGSTSRPHRLPSHIKSLLFTVMRICAVKKYPLQQRVYMGKLPQRRMQPELQYYYLYLCRTLSNSLCIKQGVGLMFFDNVSVSPRDDRVR